MITNARFTPSRFRVAKGPTATTGRVKRKPVPRGTSLSLTTNVAGSLRVAFTRTVVRHGRACHPKQKRCTVQVAAGSLSRRGLAAGAQHIPFTGRLGRHALPAGTYQASLVVTGATGRASRAVTVRFTIVRG